MSILLSIDKISYKYRNMSGETCALDQVSFDIEEGSFVSVVGPSGCGKSTLLSIIAGILSPTSGTVSYHFNRLHSVRPIGYMLQHDNLLEWRNIYKNCIIGLEINHALNFENILYMKELLNSYDLYSVRDKKPSELSGGMRQRAALIRTLVLRPELLLLDEPFSALDYQTRLMVSEDICKKIRCEKKTTILVTHDLSEAISLSDRIIVLSRGPARILDDIEIHLSKENQHKLPTRNAPKIQTYFSRIWEALYGST